MARPCSWNTFSVSLRGVSICFCDFVIIGFNIFRNSGSFCLEKERETRRRGRNYTLF